MSMDDKFSNATRRMELWVVAMAPQASLNFSLAIALPSNMVAEQIWKLHWNWFLAMCFSSNILVSYLGVCWQFAIRVWRLGFAMLKFKLIRSSSTIVNVSQRLFPSAEAPGGSIVSGAARLRQFRALRSGRQFSRWKFLVIHPCNWHPLKCTGMLFLCAWIQTEGVI